jgi:hypothetical protein
LHHRKEGWLRHQKNFAQRPNRTQPGWFSFGFYVGKPPRLRVQPMLRNIFLIAQPPLLAVMQGGEYGSISNLFTASLSALSKEASQLFLDEPTVSSSRFAV